MTLAELSALDRSAFVAAAGWVFEHSPWVAERGWSLRPFGSIDELHSALTRVMLEADRDAQLALVRAHPDLGTRARMSGSSSSEQRGAGLDRLSPEHFERLHTLNTAYRTKFGFPFLFAVKGSSVDQILEALERRLSSTPDEEFAEALRQVSTIARFRLETVVTT